MSRARRYYDPGKRPYPRKPVGVTGTDGLGVPVTRPATIAKETRQLRRQRAREARKGNG